MSQLFDIIIVGGGIAGVRAAQAAAKNGLSYKVIEANDYLGGRILTEQLDLSDLQKTAPLLPSKYKMEHGAGWIHGVVNNPLVDIFQELYTKYETEKFDDQLSDMFHGNVWYMPEYAPYELFTMVDGPTCHQFTKEDYDMYIVITCIHLRTILRRFNGMKLSEFVQPYMEFISTTLLTNEKTRDVAEILARAIGWYFHSIEAYSGTPKGIMTASDIFVDADTYRPILDDIEYDIPNDILNAKCAEELILLCNTADQYHTDDLIREYINSPYCEPDAALQGCYPGAHSTLKCGMGKLVELFIKDVEAISGEKFNVDLLMKVTGIDYPKDNNNNNDMKLTTTYSQGGNVPMKNNNNIKHAQTHEQVDDIVAQFATMAIEEGQQQKQQQQQQIKNSSTPLPTISDSIEISTSSTTTNNNNTNLDPLEFTSFKLVSGPNLALLPTKSDTTNTSPITSTHIPSTILNSQTPQKSIVNNKIGSGLDLFNIPDVEHDNFNTIDTFQLELEEEDDDQTIPPLPSYNAVISAQHVETGKKRQYYARYGVLCTASVHSIMKNINFPSNSKADEARVILNESSCPVYYKKVLFCFPEVWWDNKQFTRLFALTQDAINFKTQRCKHCHDSKVLCDEDYTQLDVSQGAYPCIMSMAREELTLTTSCSDSNSDDDDDELGLAATCILTLDESKSMYEDIDTDILSLSTTSTITTMSTSTPSQTSNNTHHNGMSSMKLTPKSSRHQPSTPSFLGSQSPSMMLSPPTLTRDSTLMYLERASSMNFTPISFCGVNMIWESHMFNKNTPVLSASIVGNFAAHLAGLDDNLVKMIVFKQLEKIYRSTVAIKRSAGDFTFPSCIPKPLWSRVTHWAENPTILQSYSLITDCTLSTEERITIAQDQHIYFAGEASHVEHGGSVHGAIFSADFAVDKILEKYLGIELDEGRNSLHSFAGLLDATPTLSRNSSHTPQQLNESLPGY